MYIIREVMYYVFKDGQGTGREVGFLYNGLDKIANKEKLRRLLSDYSVVDGYTLVEEYDREM